MTTLGSAPIDSPSMQIALSPPEPKAVKIDPRRTLLQIVDMQTDFVGPGNRENMWQAANGISSIRMLLDKARESKMSIVFQFSTAIRNPYEKTIKQLRLEHLKSDPSYGRIIDEFKPLLTPNEYIIPKTTHDIFFHTYMDELLNKLPNIDTTIVTGTVTNVCVLYAVSGYCVRGYKVIVPMDAVIAKNREDQTATLHVMTVHSAQFPPTMTLSNMISFEK